MNTKVNNQVKNLQIKILLYIDEICKSNNIPYYIVGGTLLGAIRHKGYIPWDDDIDIAMFRKDYQKLLTIMTNDNSNQYFNQNIDTDYSYVKYIPKIRLNGTKFVERKFKDLDMHHGIYIDVFILDKVDIKKDISIDRRVKLSNYLLRIKEIKTGLYKSSTYSKTFRNKILGKIFKVIPSTVINKLIHYIYSMSNNNNIYVTNFGSQYGWRKQTFPIDVYGEGTHLEFEGHQFMAPAKWEVILKSLYGDYMKLPPEEKRNSGHDVVHIDLGKYAEN